LPFNDIGIAAKKIVHGTHQSLSSSSLDTKFQLVLD
jgi:hypothetical protein